MRKIIFTIPCLVLILISCTKEERTPFVKPSPRFGIKQIVIQEYECFADSSELFVSLKAGIYDAMNNKDSALYSSQRELALSSQMKYIPGSALGFRLNSESSYVYFNLVMSDINQQESICAQAKIHIHDLRTFHGDTLHFFDSVFEPWDLFDQQKSMLKGYLIMEILPE